ncbi:hypothetical protein [Changchengzhania lutea]|uniref:hypothetical protein n=1 Tax=Changchengzhania lutea TaxID=2049305 RepID=UPI001FE2841E|nr:hypothetical protein [Changchengzhania lutea]
MTIWKEHIAFKTVTVLLILTLLVPSAVKFSHIFANHKHEVCLGEQTTHLHEFDLDCEFYKFKLNTAYTFEVLTVDFLSRIKSTEPIASQYFFISKFQRLQTALRGPPALV